MKALRQRKAPTLTVESEIPSEVAQRFYGLYCEAFGELAKQAVARQVLHEHEFMEEMVDPRVQKFLAWDDRGEVVGMCTLTRDLETVPWISPDYFAHHYPEHTARNAVFYLGFILVEEAHRRAHVFSELIAAVAEVLIEEKGVCAWDICGYNNRVLGLADATEALLNSIVETEVHTLDTQTYYCGSPVGVKKMPRMRPTPAADVLTLEEMQVSIRE